MTTDPVARWRLILDPFGNAHAARPSRLSGARNMAVDQALLESVAVDGPPTLRFYRWRRPCLSLGRNQAARPFIDGISRTQDVELVRRPTGGMAVFHDSELTYAVAVPARWLGGARATYHALHTALASGLRSLGVKAVTASPRVRPDALAGATPSRAAGGAVSAFEAAGVTGHSPPAPDPTCFATTSPGEVTVGGRKLMGSAQRCERRAILQHGSLLLEAGQSAVARIAGLVSGPASRETSLADVLGRVPSLAELTDVLAEAFRTSLQIDFERACLTALEQDRARELTEVFSSEEWTRRT